MSEHFVETHFVVEMGDLEVWKAFCRTGVLNSSKHPFYIIVNSIGFDF